MHLPLDPYFLAPAQRAAVEAAERKAEQACIQRYVPGAALGSYGLPVLESISSEPLTYLDPAQAARYGYHNPTIQAELADMTDRGSAAVSAVDQGSVKTMNGLAVPSRGCRTVGVQAVTHGISTSLVPKGNASQATVAGVALVIDQEIAQSDPRVISVNEKWSSCMKGFGYDYPNPMTAVNDKRWMLANVLAPKNERPPITATEIKTATADATCRSRANLYGVYWAVAAAYQNEWLANSQNHALAESQGQADQLMLTRTDTIIGG